MVSFGIAACAAWTLLYNAATADSSHGPTAALDPSLSLAKTTGRTAERGVPRLVTQPSGDVLGVGIAIEDHNGRSLDQFHAALRRAQAGEGQARIVFYGASHVAADLFTGYIRRELQSRFGDAGHGFVLPVHPWRSYRHRDVQVESDTDQWQTLRITVSDSEVEKVGLAGVAVESKRAGAYGRVRTAEEGDFGRTASFFELYYLKQRGGGSFNVSIDGRFARKISTRSNKVRPGYATFRVPDGPHRFDIKVRTRAPVRIFGVSVERERPGVIVDTLGINGARARYQLLWDDELYREHLRRRDPNLVVLAYGTNEAGDTTPIEEYEAELREALTRVREVVPEASCLLVGPSDRPMKIEENVFEGRPRTADIIRVQHRVAVEMGCGFFDLVAFQGGPMSTVQWAANDPAYASNDHIHYTRTGYLRLGEVLLDALLEGYQPASDGLD